MENRVSDKQVIGLCVAALAAIFILFLVLLSLFATFRAVSYQVSARVEEKQFQQDVRHMQRLGGLENYRKFKETTCNP